MGERADEVILVFQDGRSADSGIFDDACFWVRLRGVG